MSAVLIGNRWKPGHIERRDSESGAFEVVNSPMHTDAERLVQSALLTKPQPEATGPLHRLLRSLNFKR